MAILKGLHGSTGFWGLTHRGIRGIVCSSGGGRAPAVENEALRIGLCRVQSPIRTIEFDHRLKQRESEGCRRIQTQLVRDSWDQILTGDGWIMNTRVIGERIESWHTLFSAVFIQWWLHFAVCNTNQCNWIYLVIQARHQQLMCPHLKSSVLRLPMSNAIERRMSGESLLLTRTKCVRHRNG